MGVQRIASRLQHALRTGSASRSLMREADKQISRNLSLKTEVALQRVCHMMNRTADLKLKERLATAYIQLTRIHEDFRSMEGEGYLSLVNDGRLDRSRTRTLLDMDAELSTLVSALEMSVSGLTRRTITEREYEDLTEIMLEIGAQVDARRDLLSSVQR